MPLRVSFPLPGLEESGDSIRMSLIVGSVRVRPGLKLAENPKGKVAEKNLRIINKGNGKS